MARIEHIETGLRAISVRHRNLQDRASAMVDFPDHERGTLL
jgi:hypothetical protein